VTGKLLELVIANSPTALALLRGPDFTIEMANPACQALSPGEEMKGRTVAEIWPEAAPLLVPLLRVVRDGVVPYNVAGHAVPLHRAPGSPVEERYFDFSYVPLPQDGEVLVLMVASEVTAHKRVEAELQSVCAELAAIHANAPVALFVINDGLRVEKVNELAARFADRPATEIVGRQQGDAFGCLNALANPGGCGRGSECEYCAIRAAVLDSLATGASHHRVEARLSRSVNGAGEESCLLISSSPMQFDSVRKVLICAQDISEQKRTQLALESALAEKTILLKEIHHRVKNNLAVISSLLSMKADAVQNPAAKEALLSSQQRVYSMALIHEQLYGNERLDRIDFADYAAELVRRLHAAMAREPGRIAIHLALEPIELAIEQAVPCGLILNELLTNVFKYAFRGRERGRIAISFRESGAGIRELSVEDDGVGISSGRPDDGPGNSLGLRIIQVLSRQLDGVIEYEPCAGTRAVLRFPSGRTAGKR
jgi:two-component sensor histidine kinase/PAS domain-containing protein